MADQRTTDLDPIATIPDSAVFDVVDTTNTTQDPAGSSFKITKANLLKEATAAILLNTSKTGITTGQAAAILLNTAKVGITTDQAAAILLNTAKVGITVSQAAAILLNTAKTGINTTQAAAIIDNTAKVGITTGQAAAILLNTSKVGITTDQAAAILLNTAKVGITTSQAAAILLNTAKVGITPVQATAITDNTANTSKVSINNDAASITNVRSLRYREEIYSSNLDMVMQSSVGVYAWVNVFTVAFNVVNSLVTRFKNRVETDSGTFENQTALETFLGTITSTLTTVLAAITPNAVKVGKLYSVIPNTSALDATVVRNTTATRINSAGLVVVAPANIARISYLVAGGPGFILDEAQSTNLIIQSNNLSDAAWVKSVATITLNAGISPDGLNNAIKITSTGSGSNVRQNYNPGVVLNHARSIWAKTVTGTGSTSLLAFNGNSNALFNITNTWQRFNLNSYIFTGGEAFYAVDFRAAGNTLTEILVWEGQAEVGVLSSNIFTGSSAVTRNADVITLAPPSGTVKITTTFSDNTTQVLTSIPATYTMPEGLIKSVNFNNTL
jgi:hypothetical protein